MDNPFEKKEETQVEKPETPEVVKIDEPVKVEAPKIEAKSTPKKVSLKTQILMKHGGLESNVPINSPYWKM